jgi:hypothetical protein
MAKSKAEKANAKELRRIAQMMKRLEAKGYVRTGRQMNLTTRQMKNIKKSSDLVRRGFYEMSEEQYWKNRAAQREKRINDHIKYVARRSKDLEAKDTATNLMSEGADVGFNNDGLNIPRLKTFRGPEASVKIDMLMSVAFYGEYYTGRKTDKSAIQYVNNNGKMLSDLIARARKVHGDEALVAAIEDSEYGSVEEFARFLEKFVLAIYDQVYFQSDGFSQTWEDAFREISFILDHYPIYIGETQYTGEYDGPVPDNRRR